ncbi:glycosyltransferase [Bradyrhizobium sp. ARR65]|uniref:glycosyltransferase family 2 protein n=1 Tax=Bradyrhizobium sp. ARR65 TaxID=1040989 RepID=UPI00046529C9|nr:glycosyltransferase [Bradyrhizobium sp. ARR65]
MPRVSVIIRTKNRLVFLARSLLSVQQQGFRDWEIIIVNDGGDAPALEQLLAQVPGVVRSRVTVVHHATSQGRWAAANAGLKVARGDLVVIHDDDDSWHGAFLETMVAAIDRHPPSVAGVVCHTQYVDEVVFDGTIARKGVRPFNSWMQNVTLFRMASRNFIPPISLLYRASVHEQLGVYREDLPVLGDWDFYMRLLSCFEIQLVPRVLANYHLRPADAGEQFGNSVLTGVQSHSSVEASILNALLRKDLSEGKVGLGTIANLAYDLRELREHASETVIDLNELLRRVHAQAPG